MANTPQAKKRIRRNDRRAEINGAPRQPHPHLREEGRGGAGSRATRPRRPPRWRRRSRSWRAASPRACSTRTPPVAQVLASDQAGRRARPEPVSVSTAEQAPAGSAPGGLFACVAGDVRNGCGSLMRNPQDYARFAARVRSIVAELIDVKTAYLLDIQRICAGAQLVKRNYFRFSCRTLIDSSRALLKQPVRGADSPSAHRTQLRRLTGGGCRLSGAISASEIMRSRDGSVAGSGRGVRGRSAGDMERTSEASARPGRACAATCAQSAGAAAVRPVAEADRADRGASDSEIDPPGAAVGLHDQLGAQPLCRAAAAASSARCCPMCAPSRSRRCARGRRAERCSTAEAPVATPAPAAAAAPAERPPLDPRFTFERFVVDASNRVAFNAAQGAGRAGHAAVQPALSSMPAPGRARPT